ncbi:helix-turn-helix transcriptional regulator [Terribacillus aidingensis]|uniref:helix-turn-helix domain-containing protein n=1 Tax=Terribacillus aidingensis TaxID=586416 RepID=UPI00344F9684
MPFSYAPLWKHLIDVEETKSKMREDVGISSATLAKMGRHEYVAMEVLDKVCSHYQIPIEQVVIWKEDK